MCSCTTEILLLYVKLFTQILLSFSADEREEGCAERGHQANTSKDPDLEAPNCPSFRKPHEIVYESIETHISSLVLKHAVANGSLEHQT